MFIRAVRLQAGHLEVNLTCGLNPHDGPILFATKFLLCSLDPLYPLSRRVIIEKIINAVSSS